MYLITWITYTHFNLNRYSACFSWDRRVLPSIKSIIGRRIVWSPDVIDCVQYLCSFVWQKLAMFSVPLYVSHAKIWEYSKFNVKHTCYSKWIADFEHRYQLAAQKLWLSIAQIWKYAKHQLKHCSDVIMRAIVSQTTGVWIVYATVVRPQNKENPKALRRRPLWGEFTSDRWISCTKASNVENVSIWWRHDHEWKYISHTIIRSYGVWLPKD